MLIPDFVPFVEAINLAPEFTLRNISIVFIGVWIMNWIVCALIVCLNVLVVAMTMVTDFRRINRIISVVPIEVGLIRGNVVLIGCVSNSNESCSVSEFHFVLGK